MFRQSPAYHFASTHLADDGSGGDAGVRGGAARESRIRRYLEICNVSCAYRFGRPPPLPIMTFRQNPAHQIVSTCLTGDGCCSGRVCELALRCNIAATTRWFGRTQNKTLRSPPFSPHNALTRPRRLSNIDRREQEIVFHAWHFVWVPILAEIWLSLSVM